MTIDFPVFSQYFFCGLAITVIAWLIRLAGFRLPWLVILTPVALGWVFATWPWVWALIIWPYQPPISWRIVVIVAMCLIVVAILIRRHREGNGVVIESR